MAVRVASTNQTMAYILNSSEAKRSSVVCDDVSGEGDWLVALLLATISAISISQIVLITQWKLLRPLNRMQR